MASGKAPSKLAVNQTLTASYVATNTIGSFSIQEESLATLDVIYTTGTGETGTTLKYIVEFSPDDGTTYIQETYQSISGGVSTELPIEHAIAGGTGSTTYKGDYMFPICNRKIRISVKEIGVSSNFGTVTVWLTVTSDGGQQRNLAEITVTPGGTQDVNLIKVGGSSIAIGQAAMAASLPVVIASNQSAVPVSGTFYQSTQPVSEADGQNVTLGAKADAKDSHTDTTPITAMQVLKQMSYMLQNPAALAAGTNTIGTVTNGGSGKTLKTKDFSLSATGTAITAVTSKKLKVYAVKLIVSAAISVHWRDGASTALEGDQSLAANGGYIEVINPPAFLFATSAGNSLDLVITGTGTAAGRISYWDDDTT